MRSRTDYEEPTPLRTLWAASAPYLAVLFLTSSIILSIDAYRHSSVTQNATAQLRSLKQNQQDAELSAKQLRAMQEETRAREAAIQERLTETSEHLKSLQNELSAQRPAALGKNQSALRSKIESLQLQLQKSADKEDLKGLQENLAAVKIDLDRTEHDIQGNRSELGRIVGSTAEQIDALRDSLKRNFFEFDVRGNGTSQTIGEVHLRLIGTKPESHQFTIEIGFDGYSLQKKDWYVNEPIYVQPRQTTSPVEIVVRKVEVADIQGYLSTPTRATP